jgi:hypothetical protein
VKRKPEEERPQGDGNNPVRRGPLREDKRVVEVKVLNTPDLAAQRVSRVNRQPVKLVHCAEKNPAKPDPSGSSDVRIGVLKHLTHQDVNGNRRETGEVHA